MALDYVALLAENYSFYIKFVRNFGRQFYGGNVNILLYPNFLYSFSLSLYLKGINGKEMGVEDYLSSSLSFNFDKFVRLE